MTIGMFDSLAYMIWGVLLSIVGLGLTLRYGWTALEKWAGIEDEK